MDATTSLSQERTVMGIDLGTTYSCVGVWINDRVEIVSNECGSRTTPSWVAFSKEGERLVGEGAVHYASIDPENSISDAKRFIGQRFSNPLLDRDRSHSLATVVDRGDKPYFRVNYMGEEREFSPEEISAAVLSKMKSIAEAFVGHSVSEAVITVPAYFSDAQRQATKDAGLIANLKVLRIINEPTAASIAYGQDKCRDGVDRHVLVFDCGGGTHDISVLNISDGIFEVKATAGDAHLGGEDIDQTLVEFCLTDFRKRTGKTLDAQQHGRQRRRLKEACEHAKRTLSTTTVATIDLDDFLDGVDLRVSISRARFEELNQSFFKRLLDPVERVLTDAGLTPSQMDEIVLVGGTTRIPKVQQMLREYFNKDPCSSINPDECVAYGATVQASILAGIVSQSTEDMLLIDVTPLSLGIETAGEVMTTLIPRGTTIPTSKTQTFSTFADNQPGATIKILEGERPRTVDNHLLGEFQLEGIPPLPRGVPKIKVTYDVSADGILTVKAVCEDAEGVEKTLSVSPDQMRMSKEELDKRIAEAKEFAEADKQWTRRVEARSNYENTFWQSKATHKLASEEDDDVASAFREEEEWLRAHDAARTAEEYEARMVAWMQKVKGWQPTTETAMPSPGVEEQGDDKIQQVQKDDNDDDQVDDKVLEDDDILEDDSDGVD